MDSKSSRSPPFTPTPPFPPSSPPPLIVDVQVDLSRGEAKSQVPWRVVLDNEGAESESPTTHSSLDVSGIEEPVSAEMANALSAWKAAVDAASESLKARVQMSPIRSRLIECASSGCGGSPKPC